ncbi:grpE protein [Nymphaea thermarum]|nr:grpE protein [Nymphaea thermarum]
MAAISGYVPVLLPRHTNGIAEPAARRLVVPLRQKHVKPVYFSLPYVSPSFNSFAVGNARHRASFFCPFAAQGETTETENVDGTEVLEAEDGAPRETVAEDSGSVDVEEETSASKVKMALQLYREALANGDQSKITEVEAFLQSIEDEKASLASKIAALSAELSTERDRVLRISADFDNFRKRTERERLSFVSNVQGEVIEKLLPVLDNFERARAQIKITTEGEDKINNSYQNIYKQFVEVLGSLGVAVVETVGTPFDPLLHEAIMREDSSEFEEGIVIEEFRKGFKLGDTLLRPSMVKVSAGPGPAKPAEEARSSGEAQSTDQDERDNAGDAAEPTSG